MRPASPQKQRSMKYGAVIGAVVGVAIFGIFYALNHSFAYLAFIPLAAAMGWATQYVKDEDQDD